MPGTTRNVSWGRTVHKQGRDGGRETETEELRLRPRLPPEALGPPCGDGAPLGTATARGNVSMAPAHRRAPEPRTPF